MWPFTKIPTDRRELIKFAAKKLPWTQSASGYAVVLDSDALVKHGKNKARYYAEILDTCRTHNLINDLGTRLGPACGAADIELENAVNKAKRLKCHAIADKEATQNLPP